MATRSPKDHGRHQALVPLLAVLLPIMLGAVPRSQACAAEPTQEAIDRAVLFAFPSHPHSGFSVAIAHGGRIVYEKAFGYRDDGTPDKFIPKDENYYDMPFARSPTQRVKPDPRTIYEIGSVTKQFTAAAILLLSEEKKLGLDDPVNRYAPEFTQTGLTVRMLLTQRSGLPDLNTLSFLQRVRPLAKNADGSIDASRVSREIAALPVDFAPGARYEYSNSNYFVLGSIVERVSHQSLGTFLTAHIFRPLRMNRTAYAKAATSDNVAIGYRIGDHRAVFRAYPWDLAWLGGAGALTSTVEDIAHWDIALLDHRVLQPASLEQMWHGLDAGRGQGSYAMGWIEDALGSHRYLWHNGQVGGFHALNVIFPDDNLAFAILCNNQDAKPEYLIPSVGSLYFPVSGLDRVLPHSGVVLIEASLVVALGSLAIAIVAIATLRRFILAGVLAALLALSTGFLLPSLLGFVWGAIVALLPTAAYVLAVRFVPNAKTMGKSGANPEFPQ